MRPISRFVVAGGLAMVIAVLAWLMFGVAGWREGVRLFPDADGSRLEVLSDHSATLMLEQVLAREDAAWRPWKDEGYLLAPHGGVLWVRATLKNPGREPLHGVLSDTAYFPDRVDAWVRGSETGEMTHLHSGEAVAGGPEPLWSRTAAFPVAVPAGGEQVVVLRVSDYYVAHLQLRWWPRGEDFFEAQVRDVLAEFLCYGALVALTLYNLVLWVRVRFPDTGYYVLYAGTGTAFYFISNGGLALLGMGLGSPVKDMAMSGLLAANGLFLVQFARVFLNTRTVLPRADRWLRGGQAVLAALLLGVATMPWWPAPHWLTVIAMALGVTHGACLAAAVAAWRRGALHARFFVAAFGLLFAGITPALVTLLNGDILASAVMGVLAASTLEMVVLSFAVADRFGHAQRQLVEETEQRRIIEEAYSEELETEVRERTRELREANTDKDRMLTVVGHDLRGPLTGLMREAGRTDSEFARDVAQTVRVLLLLIEDLVLWARLRAGTRVLGVHRAGALVAPAAALHRTLAEHGGICLLLEVREEIEVTTDLVLAQTLVRNLLANALKFAETQVTLRAEGAPDGRVRFTVGNDGPPLPPEVAARFAAGQHEPITATGGLGLRLCREICQALGTRLEAARAAKGGTEFSFILEAARAGETNRQ